MKINLGIIASSITKPGGPSPDAWDPSKLVATGNSIAQVGNGVFMKPDGTEVYIITFPFDIRQYTLSTPFDISTAGSPTLISSGSRVVQGISFRESDGAKMYIFGAGGLHEFTLSTGWLLSSATHTNTEAVTSYMTGCYAKQDGTTFYSTNQTTEDIHEFDFSTPWDSSTQSETASIDVNSEVTNAQCVFFKPDGTRCFINRNDIHGYDVSPAWDITGAVYNSAYDPSAGIPGNGMWWSADGLYCIIAKTTGTDEYYIP